MTSNVAITKGVCPMCLKSCGIDAHVSNGKLIKVTGMKEHPFNRFCVKGKAAVDWVYSGERVTQPLRKINGEWKEISWDEAFRFIGERLNHIRESSGAKALAVHVGNPFIGSHIPLLAKRFCSLYGTPNYTSSASLCFAAKAIGHGISLSSRMLPLFPNYKGTRCVVVWGFNPEQSDAVEAGNISSARRRGANLIVIDPRRIPLARRADIHAQIRPGTDAALALGLLNVIVGEELYDKQFVNDWTIGFDELREEVKDYSPEAVERMTWVPAETIRQIARMYSTSKPATIAQGVSLDHCINGVQTSRAISIMVAITGNLDVLGGNTYSFPLRLASLRIKGRVCVSDAIGAKYPVYGKFTSETTSIPLPEAILTGQPYPVRALVVQGSNPVLTWPNASKVISALRKLDLLVVSDLFMTETAELASIFLPAASFFEEDLLKDYTMIGLPLVVIGRKAIEPLGNCLENWKIWAELGKTMGYNEYFPWRNTDELFTTLLEPTGMTVEKIEDTPGGIVFHEVGRREYLKSGFDTPSGKFEIFSPMMKERGYSPLPTFVELAEKTASQPALADKYPFVLISGPRIIAYTHSRFRNVSRLHRRAPYPVVEINTASAREMGIGDGDIVAVESPRGSIKLKAKPTESIHPRVVNIVHGWREANVNILTDDESPDTVSGFPAFKSVRCRIIKAS
jgi:anaerobic selenocysteine-containing dehydrogenase